MTSATDRLGMLLRDGGQIAVRYERRYAHPPEQVWRAITESEQLRHWFPADIVGERRTGAALELPFWDDHVEANDIRTPVVEGRVLAWDPPRLFEWTWGTDRLRWELAADGDATLLRLTTWIGDPLAHGPSGVSKDEATGTASAAAGYHVCLDQLEALLDERPAPPLHDADTAGLEATYRGLLQRG